MIDFSTLLAANNVLSKEGSRFYSRKRGNVPVIKFFAWELRCLEIIVESIVLKNKLFTPAAVDVNSMSNGVFNLGKMLIDEDILKEVTEQEVSFEEVLKELSYLIENSNGGTKNFLWDVSKHLMENVPKYSLHPEVLSFGWNMTIGRDLLRSEDLIYYKLVPDDKYKYELDKYDYAFEYMLKSFLYDLIAKHIGVSYCPHPARVPFLEAWGLIAIDKIDVSRAVLDSISTFRKEAYMEANMTCQSIPPLFSYLLRQSRSPEDLMKNAINLRNSKPCRQFRDKCTQIEEKLLQGNGGLELNTYITQINKILDLLSKELGFKSETVDSSVWIFTVPLAVPSFMFKTVNYGSHSHFNLLKDIAKLSVDTSSMEPHLERVFNS